MSLQTRRQEILEVLHTTPWGSAELTCSDSPGTKYLVTLDQDIVEKLNVKAGNIVGRFDMERTTDDAENIRMFDVNRVRWFSLPVSTIQDVRWSEQPEGLAPWETAEE
jgi:hypothetical protein